MVKKDLKLRLRCFHRFCRKPYLVVLFSKFEFTSFLAICTSKSSIYEILRLGLVIAWLGVYFWRTVGSPETDYYVFGRPKEKVNKSEYLHTQGIYNHFI